ncbi:MAG: anaerobic sulfatase maturase [Lentisphaeria bacterium]|jgi:uncharacterized protein|nr:anaerobic sulfatase maturase [Lentisphaeria bacterium]
MHDPHPPSALPFHVMVKPIGPICNLDCAYCFYLDKQEMFPKTERFRMDRGVLEQFTRQYIESQPKTAREVNFAWQGGEPTLMGIDFFRQAIELQQKYARPGMKATNALQTNGTRLDDDWGRFLREHQFLVGISIDGPQRMHDKFRRDNRNRGSHAAVMRGVDVLRRHDVEWNTLTVVQRDNGDHPETVYDFLKEIGSTFMQFIPIVEVEGSDEVSERSVRPKQFGRFLAGVFERWRQQDVGRVFVQHFDLMLGLVMGHPSTLCVHAETCGRAAALEHNGDLYSCDHFVFPEYHLGNVTDQTLAAMLDGPQQQKFGCDKSDGLPQYCRKCAFLQLCYGGCPAHRIRRTADGEDGLNYLCAGYQEFFKRTLPYFQAMAACVSTGLQACEYKRFLDRGNPPESTDTCAGRNAPCPCGSGRKYKRCCGRRNVAPGGST